MLLYEQYAYAELNAWFQKMKKKPSMANSMTKGIQRGINNLLPDKVHQAITYAIEKMVKGVLIGASFVNPKTLQGASLHLRENLVKKKIKFYEKTASVEGAVTGAGGILMGFVDFPAFLTIKMKLLFEMAALYGHDVEDYKERLFMLYVFQLAFSSQKKRNEVVKILSSWEQFSKDLPEDVDQFDWLSFQLEYRDYLDLAKLAQLIPVIGAGVGAVVNYRLVRQLGNTAMNCYRMRYFANRSADMDQIS